MKNSQQSWWMTMRATTHGVQVSTGTRAFGINIVAADFVVLNMKGLADVAQKLGKINIRLKK